MTEPFPLHRGIRVWVAAVSLALWGTLGCGPVAATCTPANCHGCCTADARCLPGDSSSSCGFAGAECKDCEQGTCGTGRCMMPIAPPCNPGFTVCGNQCTTLDTDPHHCGTCATACGTNEECAGGQCHCATGKTRCGSACLDLQTDDANCGACGTPCGSGLTCAGGTCHCAAGKTKCGSVCVDLATDANNCGTCGTTCAPPYACDQSSCVCASPMLACGSDCLDPNTDVNNCGGCGNVCQPGQGCSHGGCTGCPTSQVQCAGGCTNTQVDVNNCGACGTVCPPTLQCSGGVCGCKPVQTLCGSTCAFTQTDPTNCGGCGVTCLTGWTCVVGTCLPPCPAGQATCSGLCVDVQTDVMNCGGCGQKCLGGTCSGGTCQTCNSGTTDCDGDGWLVSEGDCCDTPADCSIDPRLVNPGALELAGNGIDDNCNGLMDAADAVDGQPCDTGLTSNSTNATDYAKAFGICRTTVETPVSLSQKTWGLISAKWLRADGSALSYAGAASIRPGFGASIVPQEGQSLVVLSSGIAADATQTNPGPNGGPVANQSEPHGSADEVSIQTCSLPYCISDWYSTPNPPLKAANALPSAPACGASSADSTASDSVMLVLRLRAPTNARSFSFKGYFLSDEYPEFVCSTFNDQLVALVTTPGGTPSPWPNPVDMNLMTYEKAGQKWPIGINVAAGTDLFSVCDSQTANPLCWDSDVSALSCSLGSGQLAGTGFEAPSGGCTQGGGTKWLTTTGSVIPGGILELRIGVWDVGDHAYDSTALIDGFSWQTVVRKPGTHG